MKNVVRMAVIFLLISLSCSPYLRQPMLIPTTDNPIVVEAVRLYVGKLYIVKSEVIPGEFYYESSTKIPKRKRVWMEIYGAENNRIKLVMIIEAKLVPSQPEQWRFDDFKID